MPFFSLDGLTYRSGVFLVLLAGSIWSTTGLMIRLIEEAQTWQILFYRSVGMTPVLFLFISYRSKNRLLENLRKAGMPAAIGAIGLVFAFAGGIFAIQSTTVANAVFLFATAPFFTAILGWIILREPVRRATKIAVGVAGLGMVIMLWEGLAVGALAGNAAAVLSAIGFAVFTIALRWRKPEDMLPTVFLAGVFAFFTALAICRLLDQSIILSPWDSGVSMFMGMFQLGLGLSIYTFGSRVVPAAELALLSMTEVLLGPFWVWVFIGEIASIWTFIGGAILMAAIAGNALSGIRRRPPKIM
jgi:drug/metabolite transporter (DMT)-like permease